MKLRLGTIRALLAEALSTSRTTTPSAPTDKDAAVPGHLPEELPPGIGGTGAVDEEAWMPGRWFPSEGEPMTPEQMDKLGSKGTGTDEVDETDSRVEGDGEDVGMSSHLRSDRSLGEPNEHEI